jgi:hypothetical protein
MLVGHSRRRRLIGSVFFLAKENEQDFVFFQAVPSWIDVKYWPLSSPRVG